MATTIRVFAARFFCSVVCIYLSITAAAADILAQGPCDYVNGTCLSFSSGTNPIPVVRSFEFAMPLAGKALVRFDGTMQCIVASDADGRDVIDLVSQIVNQPGDVPAYASPGGGRFAMRVHPNEVFDDASGAINLSSSRLINYGNPGIAKVYFKFAQLRMDPGTSCNVLSAVFSVITFP
jgi:hypothetical protein